EAEHRSELGGISLGPQRAAILLTHDFIAWEGGGNFAADERLGSEISHSDGGAVLLIERVWPVAPHHLGSYRLAEQGGSPHRGDSNLTLLLDICRHVQPP